MPTTTPTPPGGWNLAGKLIAYEAAAGILHAFVIKAGFMDFAVPFLGLLYLIPAIAWALEAFPNPITTIGVKWLYRIFMTGGALIAIPLFINQIIHTASSVDTDLGDTAARTKSGLALELSTKIEKEMVGPGLQMMIEKRNTESEIRKKLVGEYTLARSKWIGGESDEAFIKEATRIRSSYKKLAQAQKDMTETIGGGSGEGFKLSNYLPKKLTFGFYIYAAFVLAAGITLFQVIKQMIKGGGGAQH